MSGVEGQGSFVVVSCSSTDGVGVTRKQNTHWSGLVDFKIGELYGCK